MESRLQLINMATTVQLTDPSIDRVGLYYSGLYTCHKFVLSCMTGRTHAHKHVIIHLGEGVPPERPPPIPYHVAEYSLELHLFC